MQVPLEFSTRDLPDVVADQAKTLVNEQVAKLESIAHDLIACRVAVEMPQHSHRNGNHFRVRIEATLAPGKRLIVNEEPGKDNAGDSLTHVVRSAFNAMRRQITGERQKRRGDIKAHTQEETGDIGFVVRLFPEASYGFIQNAEDGRDIYFHQHSVVHRGFERLTIGTQVRYVEAMGDKGPQASTVQIIDKPGERLQQNGRPDALPDALHDERDDIELS